MCCGVRLIGCVVIVFTVSVTLWNTAIDSHIETVGLEQYNVFVNDRLVQYTVPANASIKRSKVAPFKKSIPLFKCKLTPVRNGCT